MEKEAREPDIENDPVIHLLTSVIQESLPKIQMIAPVRFAELLQAKNAFDDILVKNGAKESKINYHNLLASASISAEVESIEVYDMAALYGVMRRADNFEIYPLANGNIKIAFMFQHCFVSLK